MSEKKELNKEELVKVNGGENPEEEPISASGIGGKDPYNNNKKGVIIITTASAGDK